MAKDNAPKPEGGKHADPKGGTASRTGPGPSEGKHRPENVGKDKGK